MSTELQDGEWSDWINNEGNKNTRSPLGYNGDNGVRCQLILRNGNYVEFGYILSWDWRDRKEFQNITQYRYWIPDTETQTEPNTEKEKDMNTWTDKDEETLKELLAKKEKIEEGKRQKLEGAVSDIFWYNMDSSDLLRGMIIHADELIEALQPYRKQK